MTSNQSHSFTCSICGKPRRKSQGIFGEMVHGGVLELIHEKHPDWSPKDLVCRSCLDRFRAEYVEDAMERQKGEVTKLDQDVVRSLKEHELLTQDLNAEFEQRLGLAERTADRVASFGGSWRFIGIFALVMLAWITLNTVGLLTSPFDPYPYILLNLALSCLAAIQAPVIMMSQNRQEAKDRLRAEHDYRINLKAELEIRHLHTKLDQLLTRHWQRLLEIQRIQTELLEELARRRTRDGGA